MRRSKEIRRGIDGERLPNARMVVLSFADHGNVQDARAWCRQGMAMAKHSKTNGKKAAG